MEFPLDVSLMMKDDCLLDDMDGYDPDSYDEESIDWLSVEAGQSIEEITVDSWSELQELLNTTYQKYYIVDHEIADSFDDYLCYS